MQKPTFLFTLGGVHEVTLKEAKAELFYFFTNHHYHSPKKKKKISTTNTSLSRHTQVSASPETQTLFLLLTRGSCV